MELNKEPLVFVGTALLLGWLVYGRLGKEETRTSRRGATTPAFEHYPAPDVSRALRDSTRGTNFERDLFSPPRDAVPLSPLALEPPPLEPIEGLAPPTAWGPEPDRMGVLRRDATPTPVPGLFGYADALDENLEFPDEELNPADTLAGLGYGGNTNGMPTADLSPEERAERVAGYKRLYDWIRIADQRFGQIRNADRYGLNDRPTEPILFVEIDPETGLERFPGLAPISYERSRITEFQFADTPVNRIELRRHELGDELRPAQLESALTFADECVALRLETPRALEVAEEVYRLCETVASGDLRPRLGLARCYEAGFRFNDAFNLYRELIAGDYDKEPVVHARLGTLLAQFRLFGRADEAFAEALRWGRTNWEARWLTGRYMLERGRGEEAIEHLAEANKYEPKSPETRAQRTALRADYGRALLARMRLREADDMFGRALQADPDGEAGLAGRLAMRRLLAKGPGNAPGNAPGNGTSGEDGALEVEGTGFELTLAAGLDALHRQQWDESRRLLELAAGQDPFRAYQAWRSLSWLAEITGNPERALAFIEMAYENNPSDPYTLFQRGRLLAAQDDLDGARDSLQRALDQNLDFTDALVGMGEIARRRGDPLAAERYFERALSLDPERAIVHSMRGFNLLELGNPEAAEEVFTTASRFNPDLASAKNGLAWCTYLAGDSSESTTLFADLVEVRRNEPADDPHKRYAEAQIQRITDHEGKEVWSDRFDRRAGQRIGNGWLPEEPHGLKVTLVEGTVRIDGQMTSAGRTRVFRELSAGQFISFQADVTVHAGTRARVGISIAREERRRGVSEVQAEVSLSRNKDGDVQARLVKQGERDADYQDLFTTTWDFDQPMELRILRAGEGGDSTATLFVDGLPVLEGLRVPSLGRTSAALRFGVYVEGDTGRSARVSIDNVEVVRRVQG